MPLSATISPHDTLDLPPVEAGPEVPSGLLNWILAGVRRDLIVALCFLVVSPLLMAVLLVKAAQADRVYTSKIPLAVNAYGEQKWQVTGMMASTFDGIADLALEDSSEFRRSHEWQRLPSSTPSKLQFMSVLVTPDPLLAKQTHPNFLADFASAARSMYPDATFTVGGFGSDGAGIEVDESPVVLPTRIALWVGFGLYLAGLALVICCMGRARLCLG